MAQLNSNQEAFIQMMRTDEESARRGFELLSTYPDLDLFFDELAAARFFDPQNNPRIIPAPEPGYLQVPYWSALEYLLAAAKLSKQKSDTELAQKVMDIVRAVSNFRDDDKSFRDNHHTYRIFADILGLVPSSVLLKSDMDLIPIWLTSKFSGGMIGHALNKGILPQLLKSDLPEDWEKASIILRHCTAIRRVEPTRSTGLHKYEPVVDDYWLKEIVKNNIAVFAAKAALRTCEIFMERLREIFDPEERDKLSYIWRPAIEDHSQNHSWNELENIFVEGLRDVLLAWIDSDADKASTLIKSLLGDQCQILRRVGIHILDQRWDLLKDQYSEIVGPQLFDSGHLHEVYNLLKKHFQDFSDADKSSTVKAIQQLPLPSAGEDSEFVLRLVQRNWLSAMASKGYQPVDALYGELSSDPNLGSLHEHPDFHSYMQSSVGPGPTPYQPEELVAFAQEGTLIEKLNGFQQPSLGRGPNKRALTDALEEAVKLDPQLFVRILPNFLKANRTFQYGVINGFKKVWDAPQGTGPTLDWNHIWTELVSFFEQLILSTDFWTEKTEELTDFYPTANRDWIPQVIADFLQAGTRSDDHACPSDLLARTWRLIEVLLENSKPADAPGDDAMSRAINTQKGRAIEALFYHALRACRVSDQTRKEHGSAWKDMQPVFDRELAKCKGDNYEFSTLLGHYIAHLDYMDHAWLESHIKQVFPEDFQINYACALEGLAYASATRSVYALLEKNGILDKALREGFKGPQLREKLIERIALAYLWGDDSLESSRFGYLFEAEKTEELETAALFFWGVSNQGLSDTQTARIMDFWKRCVTWSLTIESPSKLLSTLARLSCYMTSLGEEEMTLLLAVAPHVYIGHNADMFIGELNRLTDIDPSKVGHVLEKVLDKYVPMFDFEDRLKSILTKLYESGGENRIQAIVFADNLRSLPGMTDLYNQFTSAGT
jgi:hypothetical protein